MDARPASIIRYAPFGRLPPRRRLALAVARLDPVPRIAHRLTNRLRVPPRMILDHELVLLLRGSGTFRIAGQAHPIRAHQLLFVPPFVEHTIDCGAGMAEHIAVHFDLSPDVPGQPGRPERRRPYAVRLTGAASFAPVTTLTGSPIQPLMIDLADANRPIQPLAPVRMRALLLQVLVHLLEQPPASTDQADPLARQRKLVERVIGYVNQHLAEPTDADLLADVAGISLSQLTRLFRQVTGHAPMDYVRHARIAHARRLLTDIDLSIKQVAAAAGFEDAFHFSKTFRRLVGVPPTTYRDALLSQPR